MIPSGLRSTAALERSADRFQKLTGEACLAPAALHKPLACLPVLPKPLPALLKLGYGEL